jgi:hypothetical protein
VQASVKGMEQALALLEAEVAAGAPDRFDSIRKTRFDPPATHARALIEGRQPDGAAWPGRSTGREAGIAAAASGAREAEAGARTGSGGEDAPVGETVWWPAGLTVAIVLAMLAWGWARREEYVVHATPEYRAAVRGWQAQLLAHAETASPRELKRFLNISRYAVARLRRGESGGPPEARLVELSARWMMARGRPQGEVRGAMLQPSAAEGGGMLTANPLDVDAFLQIVGDLDTGEPAVPQPATATPGYVPPTIAVVRADGQPVPVAAAA